MGNSLVISSIIVLWWAYISTYMSYNYLSMLQNIETIQLLLKSVKCEHALAYLNNWDMITPYGILGDMLTVKSGKFTIENLKTRPFQTI